MALCNHLKLQPFLQGISILARALLLVNQTCGARFSLGCEAMSMKRSTRAGPVAWLICCAFALAVPFVGVTRANAETFVAGTMPDRRPDTAPRLTTFEKSKEWYAVARTGIYEPFPPSLKFLDDQGGWFNPFIHPGMTGLYDIRGWHAKGPMQTGSTGQAN